MSTLIYYCKACEDQGEEVTFDNPADAFSHAMDDHIDMREVEDEEES